mmetsp:Transcript_5146/g.10387  ORF Transcript_5146/g.10387 Transcript_5146/m.10387 type:complete len:175 (-) Transcript_5146:59-583(-)
MCDSTEDAGGLGGRWSFDRCWVDRRYCRRSSARLRSISLRAVCMKSQHPTTEPSEDALHTYTEQVFSRNEMLEASPCRASSRIWSAVGALITVCTSFTNYCPYNLFISIFTQNILSSHSTISHRREMCDAAERRTTYQDRSTMNDNGYGGGYSAEIGDESVLFRSARPDGGPTV